MEINGKENPAFYMIDEPQRGLPGEYLLKLHRINNIENEFEEIRFNTLSHSEPDFDFIRTLSISKEEYDDAVKNIRLYTEHFSKEFFFEIIEINILSPQQRAMMEFFNYLITSQHYLNWNYFRRNTSYDSTINRMIYVNYSQLTAKEMNYMLNRLCPNCCFPQYIEGSNGLTHLLKFAGFQLTVFAYLFNNKLLPKPNEFKTFVYGQLMDKAKVKEVSKYKSGFSYINKK